MLAMNGILENTPAIQLVLENHSKASLFYYLIIYLCTQRASNGLTVGLAWGHAFIRIAQIIGAIKKNPKIIIVTYLLSLIVLIVLFFSDVAIDPADIIHEATVTGQVDLRHNYDIENRY